MSVTIKWFPPSWFQVKTKKLIIYIDPAYLRSYYTHYPKKIEFSKWPDPVDGLPEKLEKADLILATHDHQDHAKDVTVNRLRRKNTLVVGPKRCMKNLGKDIKVVEPGEHFAFKGIKIRVVDAYNTEKGNSTRKVHHKGNGVGYVLTAENKSIYHAGDTDFKKKVEKKSNIKVVPLQIGEVYKPM